MVKEEHEPMSTQKEKCKELKREVIKFFTSILLIAIFFNFLIKIHICSDGNMFPAITKGSLLISYSLDDPFKNDVVIYKVNNETSVGRIIGVAGDEIDINDKGELFINGIQANEEIFYLTYQDKNSNIKFPHIVEENSYFILNDYRENTDDSRKIGDINKKSIYGPLIYLVRMY